ncbi:MAG: colicin E5-related ribonuclease [Oscillospiraceae bacterium]|nr:colicin E5-related ribonuclease [Oscillospiraceae bacterium]
MLWVDFNGNWPSWSQIGQAVCIALVATVIVVSVVASAGAVGFVVGGIAASIGASSAVFGAATTAGIVGTYVVAGGIAICGANRVTEALTSRNFGIELFGERTYNIIELSLNMLGICAIELHNITEYTSPKKTKNVEFSNKQSQYQWKKQMEERGWSINKILKVKDCPTTVGTSINRYTGNECTVYFNNKGGYVVIDNVTNKIVQISEYEMNNFTIDKDIVK